MKQILLSTVVLLAVVGGSARAESGAFDDVPPGSWPYSAVARLVELGQVDGVVPPFATKAITRYEFAVIAARWLDKHDESGESTTKTNLQAWDIVTALRREFADELARIAGREGMPRRNSKETRIAPPPRYKSTRAFFLRRKLQLEEIRDSSPSKDFDTRIREAVESNKEKK